MENLTRFYNFEQAEQLSPFVLFGTSSWNYPGWKGSVYRKSYKNEKEFSSGCLEEYASFPWFRSAGIDSSFYGPPRKETLRRYAGQLPQGFRWVSKVWEDVTIPQYAKHKRYGERAGKANPRFLDGKLFAEQILTLYQEPEIREHTGPFVFQFQRLSGRYALEPETFFTRLDEFLGALPRDFQYAVEIRNKEFLVPSYFHLLNRHGVTHCFNHWSFMPRLKEQMELAAVAGGLDAPFYVSRILTPLGVDYEDAVSMFSPYAEIRQPNHEMRADVVRLAKRAVQRKVPAFVLVNNRAEGHAPKTVADIGSMIVSSREGDAAEPHRAGETTGGGDPGS